MTMMSSVAEFCHQHGISRGTFYKLLNEGRGPESREDRSAHVDQQRGSRGVAPPHGARSCHFVQGGGVMLYPI